MSETRFVNKNVDIIERNLGSWQNVVVENYVLYSWNTFVNINN